jgi:hypothetical protein
MTYNRNIWKNASLVAPRVWVNMSAKFWSSMFLNASLTYFSEDHTSFGLVGSSEKIHSFTAALKYCVFVYAKHIHLSNDNITIIDSWYSHCHEIKLRHCQDLLGTMWIQVHVMYENTLLLCWVSIYIIVHMLSILFFLGVQLQIHALLSYRLIHSTWHWGRHYLYWWLIFWHHISAVIRNTILML